jgi:hypothetical protein
MKTVFYAIGAVLLATGIAQAEPTSAAFSQNYGAAAQSRGTADHVSRDTAVQRAPGETHRNNRPTFDHHDEPQSRTSSNWVADENEG